MSEQLLEVKSELSKEFEGKLSSLEERVTVIGNGQDQLSSFYNKRKREKSNLIVEFNALSQ